MSKSNKILSVALRTNFLIIVAFCPLFGAKPASFVELIANYQSSYLVIIILFILSLLTLGGGVLLMFFKSKYSLALNILSFTLLIFTTSNSSGLPVGPGLVLVLFISGLMVCLSYSQFIEKFTMTIPDIVEMALYIGLAVVCDMFLKIRLMANGGSISVAMLPLFLMSLRKGFIKSFIGCGLIYGFINCLIDGYGFIYYPLDYLMCFGSMALLGLARPLIMNKENRLTIKGVISLVVGLLISCLSRLFFATVSGVVMWGTPTYWESFVYNITYLLPSLIIVIILMVALYKPLLMIEKKYPSIQ